METCRTGSQRTPLALTGTWRRFTRSQVGGPNSTSLPPSRSNNAASHDWQQRRSKRGAFALAAFRLYPAQSDSCLEPRRTAYVVAGSRTLLRGAAADWSRRPDSETPAPAIGAIRRSRRLPKRRPSVQAVITVGRQDEASVVSGSLERCIAQVEHTVAFTVEVEELDSGGRAVPEQHRRRPGIIV